MTESTASGAGLRLAVALRRISFGDGIGGMERAAALHISQMAENGARVTLYTPVRFMGGYVPNGVDIVDVPWPIWNGGTGAPTFGIAYWVWVRRLAQALNQMPDTHDVVHLHGGSAGALRYLPPFTASVVNPHGMEEFEPASLTKLPNRIFSRSMGRQGRRADYVIATDVSLVDAVIANIGVAADQVRVIPNSVDLALLAEVRRPQLERECFTIVSIGRLVRNKGYDMLLEALADHRLREALPAGWRWIHFGSGPDREMLSSRATSSDNLPLEIRSGRSDDDVQGALATANIFVQPSRHEGSSLTTLEAMAHGRTIVATAVGGIPDKISDGTTGFLAESPTPEGITDALLRALSSTEAVGVRAQAVVAERFSVEATSNSYLALYSALHTSKASTVR
jgi:glycosyltransferase involved in cell wall biosynthesis